MMSRRQHVEAICRLVEAKLAGAPAATARRLLRPQVRWAAARPDDDDFARRLGVVALVDACRDEHLSALDADDGLAALQIGWAEVAAAFAARSPADPRRCARCGARIGGARCRRCGLTRGVWERPRHG